MSETDRLLSIAGAIAEGAPVSWPDEERRVSGRDEAATLNALRELQGLLSALRGADRDDELTMETLPPVEGPVAGGAPRRWGHLEIIETIGKGTFATVYRAHDARLGLDVALKLLSSTGTGRRARADRILKEAQLLARVRHPNVVRVYGVDETAEHMGLWMEFVQGSTLRELLHTRGPFSAQEASIIGRDLCRAMAAVHQAGVLHGDIKAHNVMREAGGRIVLMDFGAGQTLTDETDDPAALLAGTPAYLAPEVLKGHPRSASSDIYALGVLLYHLVTRSYPVAGHSVIALVDAHQRGERRHLRDARPDLPDDFVRAVERAVAPDSRERFASLGQFEDALVRVTSPPQAAPEAPVVPEPWLPASLRRWGLPLAASLVLVAVGIGVLWFASRGSEPRVVAIDRAPETSARAEASPAGAASNLYDIEAAFFRAGRSGDERLLPDARVSPGDELFLKLQASVPLHVYVVNEDEKGATFLLFPLRGEGPTNPLPAGQLVTVPGATRWLVSTPGEREHFLVFASPEPVDSLEETFARLPSPRAGVPIGPAELPRATVERLRGVGGLTPAPAAQRGEAVLSRLFTSPLTEALEHTRGLWVRQLTLENPVR
jgi:serine/threonine protein kinase